MVDVDENQGQVASRKLLARDRDRDLPCRPFVFRIRDNTRRMPLDALFLTALLCACGGILCQCKVPRHALPIIMALPAVISRQTEVIEIRSSAVVGRDQFL